jgi:hypothetical protein
MNKKMLSTGNGDTTKKKAMPSINKMVSKIPDDQDVEDED